MKSKYVVPAVIILAAAVVIASIPSFRQAFLSATGLKKYNSGALQHVTIRQKWVNYAQFTGIYVAIEKGFYKDEGLDVTTLPFDPSNPSLVGQLDKGEVDFATVNQIEVVQGVSQGKNVKALAATYQISPYAILSHPQDNIKTPLDFRGKRLGMTGGTDIAKLIYGVMMKKYNVDPKAATFVPLDFDTAQNYINHKADTFNFYRIDEVYQLKQKGVPYSLMLPENFGLQMYESMLVTSDKMIAEHPDTVAKFVRATLKGWDYALNNIPEATDITMKYVTQPSYKDYNYEKFILEQSKPLIKTGPYQKIGDMNFVRWQSLYESMRESGFIDKEFDITKAYTTQFLP